tara:strand:+ start:108 stop:275 length:168 start_codon:yes stop_codon:yes gene_type:complete
MLPTFIITILIILICISIMSLSAIIKGKAMSGSCGGKDNPCECTLVDKFKCKINE